ENTALEVRPGTCLTTQWREQIAPPERVGYALLRVGFPCGRPDSGRPRFWFRGIRRGRSRQGTVPDFPGSFRGHPDLPRYARPAGLKELGVVDDTSKPTSRSPLDGVGIRCRCWRCRIGGGGRGCVAANDNPPLTFAPIPYQQP